MACLTLLEIEQAEREVQASVKPESEGPEQSIDQRQAPSENTKISDIQELTEMAMALFDAASRIVVTGYERVSTVMIGQLIQAAHHARASGLHWPAAAAIRVAEGIRQQRTATRGADSTTLRRDMFELLSTTRMIHQQTAGWQNLPGTARRKYHPHEALRLQGVMVEPILTDSGYAGMVVYLKDDKHNWFTISDVRLGGAERLAGVWKGGIPIGNKSTSANDLINSRVLIRGGGVSDDGRLGLGSKSEFAWESGSEWAESMQEWLQIDLATQLRRVWSHRFTPELARPAGWDLVGLQVEVLGAFGKNLIVRILKDNQRIPLGIHSENAQLEYRRNLERLAATPGMLLNVIARFDFTRPAALLPLAISPCDSVEHLDDENDGENENDPDPMPRPKLILTDSDNGCWQLGWQRLQPENFSRTTEPVILESSGWAGELDEAMDPMRRRIQSMLQGGHHTMPDVSSDSLQIDSARFLEAWFETAASLLMEMSTGSATLRAAETRRETHDAIQRLADLWIAGEAWSETIGLMNATQTWIPTGVID